MESGIFFIIFSSIFTRFHFLNPVPAIMYTQQASNYNANSYRDALSKSIIGADVVRIFDYLLTIGVEE